jgi:hypothetical protein
VRIAFATCSAHPHGRPDDAHAAAIVEADQHVWDDPEVDWAAYDRVLIRSVWDYSHRPAEFLEWCRRVGPQRLRNGPELIAFNLDKRYLGRLGVPVVPTTFLAPGASLEQFDSEVVIKPNISAGARNTGRFGAGDFNEALELVSRIHESGRVALVQPYLEKVSEAGETAIVFLGGVRSHTLIKRAVLRDLGVAPLSALAHGPAAVMLEPDLVVPGVATAAEFALAEAVHAEVSRRFGTPVYARVDMVPGADGKPVLLELEAMEPNLYLDLSPGAARRLAEAVLAS